MKTTALVAGSMGALANQQNTSLAESFMQADMVLIVDVSGSMSMNDARGGRKRYDVAVEELSKLQQRLPGKIAVVAFSSHVEFCPGGIPPYMGGTTDLAGALSFVRVADGCVDFIVISDGEPDSEEEALRIASSFSSKIDTIYIGPENERWGADFLQRLASAAGGRYAVAEKANKLLDELEKLMLCSGEPDEV